MSTLPTPVRRELLRQAIISMVARYGDAERRFVRHPLESSEGRKAGRAAARRFRAVERLTRALAEDGTR